MARAKPPSIMLATAVRQKATVRQRRSDLPHLWFQHKMLRAQVSHFVLFPLYLFCCCVFLLYSYLAGERGASTAPLAPAQDARGAGWSFHA